ncbi:hypothetical protein F4780DRAFT_762298 [Xylariomycetidae sp. FL0641]|nr:hypothetical protein F4780DRAFT_762298 [Xylariomycetidae sp. FL0641]
MDATKKRKHDAPHAPQQKRSKQGGVGKWSTPHLQAKLEALKAKSIEVGDQGMWVTCQRGKERQALEELMALSAEYGKKLYNIDAEADSDADDGPEDIEASIQNELAGMKAESQKKSKDAPFEPMRMGLDCLLFMRTRPPVEPRAFARAICRDAKDAGDKRMWKSRFINKFTPITLTGKATLKGVEEVARTVLEGQFALKGADEGEKKEDEDGENKEAGESKEDGACSYAIRPSFRSHNTLKRNEVIDLVAKLIAPQHKVNLTKPDKVILIDIYQTFCGMSVVDGEWEDLKRYNLHELYLSAAKSASASRKAEASEKKQPAEGDAVEEEGPAKGEEAQLGELEAKADGAGNLKQETQ